MRVQIDIDIEQARKVLELTANGFEEMQIYENMPDGCIKKLVLKHIKCWAITEVDSNL